MYCMSCGKKNAEGVAFCTSCRKPMMGYSVAGGAPSPGEFAEPETPLQPAGFWLRFIAACIDFLIVALLVGVVTSFTSVAMGTWREFLKLKPGESPADVTSGFGTQAMLLIFVSYILLSWLYFSSMECSSYGGTFGKMIVGLRVTDARGNRVSFGRATGRFAGGRLLIGLPYFGAYYFLADCICAGFTPNKQAVHDIWSGCLVLRKMV